MSVLTRILPCMICACLLAVGCEHSQRPEESEGEPLDSVRVAAAWSWRGATADEYWNGIELALAQINDAGGVNGLPLAIHRFDDLESIRGSRLAAQEIAAASRYAGVIGHLHSDMTMTTAPIYAKAGLPVIAPASTDPRLTGSDRNSIIRLSNSDDINAMHLARIARGEGYRRIAVIYARTDYGTGLADAIEEHASLNDLEIVDRRSYDESGATESYYAELVADWAVRRLDAVLLAGTASSAGSVVAALRRSGVNAPILGGDGLDDRRFLESARGKAEGTFMITFFHPENPRPEVQAFATAYKKRYGKSPDCWAARGYDATWLLANAMNRAGSAAPEAVGASIRSGERWPTLAGEVVFDSTGEPEGRAGVLVQVIDGRLKFVREMSAQPVAMSDGMYRGVASAGHSGP